MDSYKKQMETADEVETKKETTMGPKTIFSFD